jgi:drug/metabolite transporter (DMT)-like permease
VDAVVLSLVSAFLFGAMTVAIRFGFAGGGDASVASAAMTSVAFGVALAWAVVSGSWAVWEAWPFALAGLIAPGISQIMFTRAVREAGPSRTSVVVGTAPLAAVVIAVVFLDEPLVLALAVGAALIVVGGLALASERIRPDTFRVVGLVLAFGATIAFAVRDNILRWLSLDTDVAPAAAGAAALGAGALLMLAFELVTAPRVRRQLGAVVRSFAPAGILFGLSYVCLFEAYYRGRVSVVSPLVATESLWAVALSALLLRRHELVGPRLFVGAALVVAGGALIGATR